MSQNSIINRFKTLTENKGINISVQRETAINETASRLLVSFAGRPTEKAVAAEVAKAWGGKVRLAQGSVQTVGETAGMMSTLDIIVKQNSRTIPFSDLETAGMTTITANVFSDADDNVWAVRGEGDSRLLVMTSNEDLSDVLATRRSVNIATASVNYSLGEHFQGGDYIMYYDVADEKAHFGIALEEAGLVFNTETKQFHKVSPEQVLVVNENTVSPEEVAASTRTQLLSRDPNREPLSEDNMLSRHLEYMKELYSKRGDYFRKLEDLIKTQYGRQAVS